MVEALSASLEPTTDSLVERLFRHAEISPTHDAIVTGALTISYAQLAQLIRMQAKLFNTAGISQHSVVGIKCSDDTQQLILCLAAAYVGATSITIPTHEEPPAQEALIKRCGVSDVVEESVAVNLALLESSSEVAAAPFARLIFSTSGTTGNPKLVIHHDSDLVEQAHRHIGSEQERFACLASMEHNFAKRHRLYCVAVGATNVFLGAERQSLGSQCKTLAVNVLHVSAFQAQELLAIPDVNLLSSLRLKLGGSHVTESLRQQLRSNITENLQAGYGTTETGAIGFTDPGDPEAHESVGQPLPGIKIRAVTPNRKPLAAGERGELAISCSGMFRGYFGDTEQTAARLEDGWFYTGDVGYLDDKQRIYLCGRADDMFVFNSMNIYPQDIESQLCQYPGVIDAAVLPRKSAVHGCIPIALVVFSGAVKPKLSALEIFMREQLGLRCPRQFIQVEEIPRNTSGKISRQEIVRFTEKIEQHRKAVIQALDASTRDSLKPAVITAFENDTADIRLGKIGMDSLARMNFLIALELNHDLILTPKELFDLGSLGKIAERVLLRQLQAEPEQQVGVQETTVELSTPMSGDIPYVIRFFQRIFSYCHTVAQLNKALITLEHRLTPNEIELLDKVNQSRQLIPSSAAEKFQLAFIDWMQRLKGMLRSSGKTAPEPFVAQRIAPAVTLFAGPGLPANKTLVVCFSAKGGRSLMVANAVLMQHTDASRYDLLVIAEPLNALYQFGVPLLGNNVTEVIDWIANLKLIRDYAAIRTMGSSAGAYPAVAAAYRLGAELAVSVGGSFHSAKQPGKIFERILTTWRAVRKGSCDRVLMCYGIDKTRDRNYAKIMARLTGGSLVAVEITNGVVGHNIIERLVERGELAQYFARTIYANMNENLISTPAANVILSFPLAESVPCQNSGKS